MSLLVLKIVLAPAFVVLASVVGGRHGVRVGGVVGGLPAIAGPILLVLALEHGRARSPTSRSRPPPAPPRWDLLLRAGCAAVPVVAVTQAAQALGPHLSGLAAAFPIITPVLAAFTHAQQGPEAALRTGVGSSLDSRPALASRSRTLSRNGREVCGACSDASRG